MKAAFFDFDDTLTHGDTLPLWLATCRGWPLTMLGYLVAVTAGGFLPAQGAFDRRGRIKATLLRLILRGYPADRAAQAGALMKPKIHWHEETLTKLRRHAADGHRVVIVTGAATIYLPALLDGLPVDEVLGTRLEVVDSKLTGRLDGVNCVRTAKAEIVRQWLEEHRPEETWGYGNDPHDLPMLALLDHRTIV